MSARFADVVGVRVEEAAEGRSFLRLALTPMHLNLHGIVHGGVPFTLADTAMGAAVHSRLAPGQACVTVEIKISFFKPAQGDELVAVARVVHLGRTLAHVEADVHAGERLVSRATGTFAVIDRRP